MRMSHFTDLDRLAAYSSVGLEGQFEKSLRQLYMDARTCQIHAAHELVNQGNHEIRSFTGPHY